MMWKIERISDILRKIITDKVDDLSTRSWTENIIVGEIIRHTNEKTKDKETLNNLKTLRDNLKEQRLLKIDGFE